jgi:hypothetical protein
MLEPGLDNAHHTSAVIIFISDYPLHPSFPLFPLLYISKIQRFVVLHISTASPFNETLEGVPHLRR